MDKQWDDDLSQRVRDVHRLTPEAFVMRVRRVSVWPDADAAARPPTQRRRRDQLPIPAARVWAQRRLTQLVCAVGALVILACLVLLPDWTALIAIGGTLIAAQVTWARASAWRKLRPQTEGGLVKSDPVGLFVACLHRTNQASWSAGVIVVAHDLVQRILSRRVWSNAQAQMAVGHVDLHRELAQIAADADWLWTLTADMPLTADLLPETREALRPLALDQARIERSLMARLQQLRSIDVEAARLARQLDELELVDRIYARHGELQNLLSDAASRSEAGQLAETSERLRLEQEAVRVGVRRLGELTAGLSKLADT
ncbi:hypothetical protein GC722_05470 [Auraticoccus sp. F435]|uniref:Uncharacterized protein n=1 Tax=Auraticoccus cholistanensis TaxID=2656650 RepID=A0A6A9V0I8_9ACTN|nr:hypothetical protein [Auraticoccus cholistanensis]MVA75480.1 hypothetical protein [Auraticoccus cholistanensis]